MLILYPALGLPNQCPDKTWAFHKQWVTCEGERGEWDGGDSCGEEREGTAEHSLVFEEAQKQPYSDMPQAAEGSENGGNGIGKFSGGKWVNLKNIGKLLAMLVGLGESILAAASSYEKTSPLWSQEQQWPF